MEQLIEKYFGPMSGWSYVAWMHFQVNNSDLYICKDCESNIIFTPEDLCTKLSELYENNQADPNHDDYKTLVKRISFSLLSQDIGTPCTITSMVDNKVVGKGGKQGQGDYKSYLFWTLVQANIMLAQHNFVLFTSAWSTGKTLCMREKAKICAAENPGQKIFFVVCNYLCKKKTLLEMDLEQQFCNFDNIEVTSNLSNAANLGPALLSMAQTNPGAAFFIDEAVFPEKLSSLSELLSQVVTTLDNGGGMLWLSVAGYSPGINIPDMDTIESSFKMFLLPVMSIPLRSTREVLAMAGVQGITSPQILNVALFSTSVSSYTIPPLLMPGLPGIVVRVNNCDSKEEVLTAVRTAREEMTVRTGVRGSLYYYLIMPLLPL